jgi:hypothetical protein
MSQRVITELSGNKMVLDRYPVTGKKSVWNFVTPTNWRVGDVVVMAIHMNPYDVDDVNLVDGKIVVSVPPEPPNGWRREFYRIRNTRTNDEISVDFDSVGGFDQLEKEYRQNQGKD